MKSLKLQLKEYLDTGIDETETKLKSRPEDEYYMGKLNALRDVRSKLYDLGYYSYLNK